MTHKAKKNRHQHPFTPAPPVPETREVKEQERAPEPVQQKREDVWPAQFRFYFFNAN